MRIFLLVIPACLLVLAEARRVQLRARIAEPQVYYEEEDDAQPAAETDDYSSQIAYQPRTRALPSPRSKDTIHGSKPPPVQTIRNYNKVNDDGSFTFGYEAADGSFKEETRGTDCVVRGKYGYVDPDGNKREFTYVSGNPCDPNAPKDEDDDELVRKQEADDVSGPANYPSVRPVPRPIRPNYPATTQRAPTTIFQTEYQLADDDASQELEEEAPRAQQIRPSAFRNARPQYVTVAAAEPSSPLYQPAPTTSPTLYRLASTAATARYNAATTPAPVRQSSYYQPIETSTRAAVTRARPQSVAITPRPHVAQVAAQYVSPSSTERPGVVFAPRTVTPVYSTTTSTPPSQHLDFAAELERYVNSVGSPTPKPQVVATPKYVKAASSQSAAAAQAARGEPIYQSELVYDPSTGQYNTQLYQSLPQTLGDFSLSHKLQPFVATQQQPLVGLSQSPIYRSAASVPQPAQQSASRAQPQPQEAIYRKQQQQLLQQSQQLYAQQQRRQQQPAASPAHQRIQLLQDPQRDAQNFYYIAAAQGPQQAQSLSVGQIDQFLRGGGSF
ncbi:nuclear receptor corepressor 1-like [Phymastichus coffea]|uniref:nuclear receptor corepressor 1-like n=1 Tax=Phymastichus coffea TaxID=108790 RepID=UPI00273BF4A3|nr:nuclear receptor corepressor 1-like [Phymastichus coffea]